MSNMSKIKYPLRILLWESTLRCNAYCEFCGSRCGDASCCDELSKNEICRVFEIIADKYDASQIMINVTGGEPLMRNDIAEIMQYANSLGYTWGLVTNGMLLTADIIKSLKQAGMKTVSISIDGLFETHDSLRGVKGGLKAVVQGLRLLSQTDFLETIMITTVVSQKNINELDAIKKLLLTLPINIWRICPVDPIGRAENDDALLLDKAQMRWLFDYIDKCRHEYLPFKVTTSCSHYLGEYEFKTRSFPFECNAGRSIASILSNGDIFVCPNVPRHKQLIQGNVRFDDFVEVWENRFKYFRDNDSRHKGQCSDCLYYSSCRADSMHTWDYINERPLFCMKEYGLEPGSAAEELEKTTLSAVIGVLKGNHETITDAWVKAQSLSKDVVVIAPPAVKNILKFFNWGTDRRSAEQICALIGRIYRNSEVNEEAFIVCVDEVLPLEPCLASDDTLIADEQLENQVISKSGVTHIGYIHSHPNELEISMSLGDYKWHRKLYDDDWKKALTIIINPQKKHIAAYAGPAADHVELHMIGYSE